MKKSVNFKKWITSFLVIVMLVSCFAVFDNSNVEAKDYTNNGCVSWVKDRASAKLGITLPATGKNKYGLYGANNYWYTLNYSKGSEPRANSLAIWEFNNGSDGQGGKYGHVAFVESVDGNNVTVTEGGCIGYSYDGNTGVICRTQNKSKMATLGGCSGFLGYVYLTGSVPPAPVNYNPECYLDSIEGGANSISVRGWAFDRDNLSAALEIQVFIGGPSGTGEGHAIKANVSRKDVHQVHSCGENHGFSATITTYKRGRQEVYIYAINIGTGVNVLLAKRTVEIGRVPTGYLDAISGGEGNISVRGWAFDIDNLSEALEIQVFIGGPSGTGEGYAIKANVSRKDVHQVHSCGENHGFSATIPTYKRGQQDVYIYLINIGIGENVLLAKRTVEIGRGPTGDLDAILGGKGNISVRGWAFDIDQTSQPLSVHVYIGGPAGSDTGELHQITANKYRPDVNKVFSCGDYHGFDDIIKTNKSGTQDIYIYMKNVGQGQDILLAKRSVSIEKKSEASATPTTAPTKNRSESLSTKTQKQKLIKKPGKVKIKKIKKSGRGCAKVTWGKVKCTNGYQIQYSRKRNFSGKKKDTAYSRSIYIFGKSKNTYYVRVRAVNQGYISQSRLGYKYGSWSRVKKIKLK